MQMTHVMKSKKSCRLLMIQFFNHDLVNNKFVELVNTKWNPQDPEKKKIIKKTPTYPIYYDEDLKLLILSNSAMYPVMSSAINREKNDNN